MENPSHKYKHDWSRPRTHALLSLLKTHAPTDFRTHVLERAHALQQAQLRQAAQETVFQRFWQMCRIWWSVMSQPRLRWMPLTVSLGTAVLLLLGVSSGRLALQSSGSLQSVAAVSQPDAQAEAIPAGASESPADPALAPLAAGPSTPPGSVICQTNQHAAAEAEAASLTGYQVEAVLIPPPPPTLLQFAHESSPEIQAAPTPRVEHKRSLTGKNRRAKRNHSTGKHTPA
jgi:hypothetical protein